MAFILLESKRDDLLLPYLNALKERGIEKPLGQFKKDMLVKLSGQASLPNVSLGSNFYLVGAVRYYFNGDLTTDGKAAYAENGDPMSQDNWNIEVCKKLNALINILRNAHIDSIGTEFEQPEDFGTLPIAKLFRKYGKKIEKEFGEEEQNVALQQPNSVGNGYTFKIIYTFKQAEKFCAYTAPGSWCITRQPNWFNDYIRSYDVHYIFFLKDGYQDIDRRNFPGPGYTKLKPHDEYGNSMIAFLQSNSSWKPVIITSRWNHGDASDGTSGTEADRAYTLEEFCQITGVTEEDLQRIYEMWRNKEGKTEDKSEAKKLLLGATRKIKYAQILINGGEKPSNAFASVGITIKETLWGKEDNESKAVVECSVDGYVFLMDRGKILFETISLDSGERFQLLSNYLGSGDYIQSCKNAIAICYDNYTQIYNIRYHEFVNIDGVTKFKRLPTGNIYESAVFIEVKNSKTTTALLSTSDLRPLKLPNGKSWFLFVRSKDYWHETDSSTIEVSPIRADRSCVIEIWATKSKNIFYNLKTKSFFDSSILQDEDKENLVKGYNDITRGACIFSLNSACMSNSYFALYPVPLVQGTVVGKALSYCGEPTILFDSNCKKIDVDGKGIVRNIEALTNFILLIKKDTFYSSQAFCYDLNFKKYIGVNGKPLRFYGIWRMECTIVGDYCTLDSVNGNNSTDVVIYNHKTGCLLENPCGWPSNVIFRSVYLCEDLNLPSEYENIKGVEYLRENPQPFAIVYTDKFSISDYRDKLWDTTPNIRWSEIVEKSRQEEAKHRAAIPLSNFREIPNDVAPEENGLEVNESTIRRMVKMAINEVIRRNNDIKRI